jgi:hypothetical protein
MDEKRFEISTWAPASKKVELQATAFTPVNPEAGIWKELQACSDARTVDCAPSKKLAARNVTRLVIMSRIRRPDASLGKEGWSLQGTLTHLNGMGLTLQRVGSLGRSQQKPRGMFPTEEDGPHDECACLQWVSDPHVSRITDTNMRMN